MSLGVPGNASLVNFLMRFPVLIPVAAAAGISTVAIQKPAEVPPPKPAIVEQIKPIEVPPPKPIEVPMVKPKPAPKPLETICPPVSQTSKLSKKQKQELKNKGCKIKG